MPPSTTFLQNSALFGPDFHAKLIVPLSDQIELKIVSQAFVIEIWFKVKKAQFYIL